MSKPSDNPPAVSVVPIDQLLPDAANVRRRDSDTEKMLVSSLKQFGAGRSIVLDSNDVVKAGNGTLKAACEAGFEEVLVVEPKPGQLVAVKRADWSPSMATAYGVADNRLSDRSEFIPEALGQTLHSLAEEGFDFEPMGFTLDEANEYLPADGDGVGGSEAGESDENSDEGEPGDDKAKVFPDDQIIEAAFAWFRETGFPYRNLPVHVSMQEVNKLAATDADLLLRSDLAYQVPDTYHPHRLHAAAEGMRSPFDAFQDDKALRKAIRQQLEENGSVPAGRFTKIDTVNGTQGCANFRPGFACKLYRDYCQPGDTVLDTSTGYGGRLVGFMASGIAGRYIGIDPNTKTYAGNLKMAADLGFADKVELINLPAEDVPHDRVEGRCDFAFTSPPYFRKEHYSEEPTQSWKRYPTGDAWRDGFLVPMLRIQFAALKPGKFAIVNIADVKIKAVVYPLAAWTIESAEAVGFEYVRTDEFPMQRRFGAGHTDEVATEPVIVLRKSA